MKAMVLAAGLGTRLGQLTATRPKALVEVAGRTLLEIALRRLRDAGIMDVIINVHHFSDMIVDYLAANANFGMRIEISREKVLLDTGGGLKEAAHFFLKKADGSRVGDEPFLLHNVDVVSSIDFEKMLEAHARTGALATLAVQSRRSSRYLLFDQQGTLCGRRLVREQVTETVRPAGTVDELAFSGIHVISPRMLSMIDEEGVFSIITTYLRLASRGEAIKAFRADGYYWRDLGKPEDLAQAQTDLAVIE
jgi:NDP-sugar pyrophosphorylase family protein